MYTNHCNLTVTIYKGRWESNKRWVLVIRVEGGASPLSYRQAQKIIWRQVVAVAKSRIRFLIFWVSAKHCCDKNPANCEAHTVLRVFTPKPYAAVGIKLYMDQRFGVKELYILGFNHLKVAVQTCMMILLTTYTPFFVTFKRTNPIV